jgi:hypothetical protein
MSCILLQRREHKGYLDFSEFICRSTYFLLSNTGSGRWSQWLRGLRPGSSATRFWYRRFESRWGHWRSSLVFVVCCGSSGLCDELITRPEDFYRVLCVWVRSWSLDNEATLVHWGLLRRWKQKKCSRIRNCPLVVIRLRAERPINLRSVHSRCKRFQIGSDRRGVPYAGVKWSEREAKL